MTTKNKTMLIASSMGCVAFGFGCFMQFVKILKSQNNILCYEDVGFTDVWIPELLILVLLAILSTLAFSIMLIEAKQ